MAIGHEGVFVSSSKSAEEAKQDYIMVMGDELGSHYHALWQELVWAYRKWNEYLELFGTKSSRIELLNNAAPSFFYMYQTMGWEDALLHLARMTDPTKPGNKHNLTIQWLPQLIPDAALSQAVGDLVGQAVSSTEFCRDWRNRRIAHTDLDHVLAPDSSPLEKGSRRSVREAKANIAVVLNAVARHYLDSESIFDVPTGPQGSTALISLVDDGLKVQGERGVSDPKNFEPRDL